MIISDSRFLISKGGAYRDDNTIEEERPGELQLGSGLLYGPKPNVPLTKTRYHRSFLGKIEKKLDLADG
jgi:hypothetical protein